MHQLSDFSSKMKMYDFFKMENNDIWKRDILHLKFQSIFAKKMANFDSWCFYLVHIVQNILAG